MIAINQHPTVEEQDILFGIKENVREKIIKAVRGPLPCIILNVETVITQSDVAHVLQIA